MPLDRDHTTPAARIMLPFCVLFFGVVGTNFAVMPDRLTQSPMLRYADTLMSLHAWGALFLTCSLIMFGAIVARSRYWYRYGLLICILSMGIWTTVAVAGAFVEPVSFSAWAWPAFIGGGCWATFRSLRDEQNRRS